MKRFACQSLLTVSYAQRQGGRQMLRIHFEHHEPHVHYYDVGMPEGAAAIIWQHAEWLTPVQLTGKVQQAYPHVTSQQVSTAGQRSARCFGGGTTIKSPH